MVEISGVQLTWSSVPSYRPTRQRWILQYLWLLWAQIRRPFYPSGQEDGKMQLQSRFFFRWETSANGMCTSEVKEEWRHGGNGTLGGQQVAAAPLTQQILLCPHRLTHVDLEGRIPSSDCCPPSRPWDVACPHRRSTTTTHERKWTLLRRPPRQAEARQHAAPPT
jgi:hypothetical protein